MSKLKGLLSANKRNEEASAIIMPYNKRIQQYQKVIRRINQVYDKVLVQPYCNFLVQLQQINKITLDQLKPMSQRPSYYFQIIELFMEIQKTIRNINSEIKDYSNQSFKAISQECQRIKRNVNGLYQKLQSHQLKQYQLIQQTKKYAKNHKSFLHSIDSYKQSFQDVKIIYNNEEKIKRYKSSAFAYNNVLADLKEINQNIEILTATREQLKQHLESFRIQSLEFVRIVGQQILKLPQNIIKYLVKQNKAVLKILAEKTKTLDQKSIKVCFQKFRLPFPNPEYYSCELKENQNVMYPNFLQNLKHLKPQHFGLAKKILIQFYTSTRQDIKQRQQLIQKLKVYFFSLASLLDKLFVNEHKQAKQLMNQKYIKMIQMNFVQNMSQIRNSDQKQLTRATNQKQAFPISETVKSMLQFMEQEKELSENMNKLFSQQIRQFVQELDEEGKLLMLFKDQFKLRFYSLFIGKKQFKRDVYNLKCGQVQGLQLREDQIKQMRQDIIKKSQFVVVLVKGFVEKFKTNYGRIKACFNVFLEGYTKYFGYEKQLHQKYRKRLEGYTAVFIQKRMQDPQNLQQMNFWIDDNKLYQAIVREKLELKFDSQIDKVSDFKKLKKPVSYFDQKTFSLAMGPTQSPLNSPRQRPQPSSQQAPLRQDQQIIKPMPSFISQQEKQQKNIQDQSEKIQKQSHKIQKQSQRIQKQSHKIQKQSQRMQKQSHKQKKQSGVGPFKLFFKNYQHFVQGNTNFQEDQKYVSNFSCGLADNIIISGRLYITTHRLFFHSRFNSSNIFFGETKLQIPKQDIKKIQKKYNALIFDNSISITTVNGEIFFTSFISRDKAFDMICKTFNINLDDEAFVSEETIEEVKQNPEAFNINIQQQDDLQDNQIQERGRKIDQLLQLDQRVDEKASQVPYQLIMQWELQFPGINAVKLFRIFDSGQQMAYKNKTYQSFWHYFKAFVHKNQQLDITSWQPNILQFLNPCNVKSITPLKFSRRIQTNVPAPQTSIPFMPKFIQSVQTSELYFYSKDKYVMIMKVQNSKAPYTDTFFLRFKKVVQKVAQDRMSIQNSLKIVFVKKTMAQSMIQSRTIKQSQQNGLSCSQQMKKYLKYLQNTIIRKKAIRVNDPIMMDTSYMGNLQQNQANQDDSNVQNLQKVNKQLKNKLKAANKLITIMKVGLLVLFLLSLILLITVFGKQQGNTTIL